MVLKRALQPSLLRTLLVRSLLVAVVPLIVLGAAVSYVADRVILQQFEEESGLVAATAATSIAEFVQTNSHYASLIAEIEQTKTALVSKDPQVIKAQLLPLKSRLGLEAVSLADPQGVIIAGAQDPIPGDRIPETLLISAQGRVEQAWAIAPGRSGDLVMRVIAPVRRGGEVLGFVEVATRLDSTFLRRIDRVPASRQGDPEARQLILIWGGVVRAWTIDGTVTGFPSAEAVGDASPDGMVGEGRIGSASYYAIYTLVESHGTPIVLGVLISRAPIDLAHQLIRRLVLALLAILAAAAVVYSYRSAESLTRPLEALVLAAQRIQNGVPSVRLERHAAHEIGALESAFDRMALSLEERDRANRGLLAELQVQALSDSLTGLPNRILFQDRLRQQILVSARSASRFPVFVMDIDRFKEVNDSFGHETGDRLLVAVGERIEGALRESDTVARFGGDEFALLIPTADTDEKAMMVARKVRTAFEAPFELQGVMVNVEGSIGIATFPDNGEDPQTLIKHADEAMYVAKRDNSGYEMYTMSHQLKSLDRLLLMGEFRQAVERDELVLHFQPEVDPRTGEIVAVEALVRWQHPTRGLLSPDQFVPLAEQSGLIRPLTRWVIDNAVHQVRLWRAPSGRPMVVAVNMSARDFQDADLPDHVTDALRRCDMEPGRLKLEITESVIMVEAARSLETLATFRKMGVRLSIDDFGTGYSSLSYLKRLPVDEIKIDRSFVIDIVSDHGASSIVRATIELAHNLRRTVVAEGVEDQATVALLVSFGCDAVQGYYFTRPVAADEMARLLTGTPTWVTRARVVDLAVESALQVVGK